jgi:putative transposase
LGLNEFVNLAVVLDGFSRKVVGWKLDRTLPADWQSTRWNRPSRHGSRCQGWCTTPTVASSMLPGSTWRSYAKHEMVSSMSRPANPYDNASCESFIKTLKREEIYANQYQDLDHLRSNIEEFIERYYNQKRLHSALGYRSPEEFEQDARRESETTTVGATVRFFPPSGEKTSTLLAGKGLRRRPFPRPHPCWKINEMGFERK